MNLQANLKQLSQIPSVTVAGMIRIYQHTLSPDHGWFKALYPQGYCRFYPTCSEYGHATISNDGLVRGLIKTVWRILRCNPFNKGGIDQP